MPPLYGANGTLYVNKQQTVAPPRKAATTTVGSLLSYKSILYFLLFVNAFGAKIPYLCKLCTKSAMRSIASVSCAMEVAYEQRT